MCPEHATQVDEGNALAFLFVDSTTYTHNVRLQSNIWTVEYVRLYTSCESDPDALVPVMLKVAKVEMYLAFDITPRAVGGRW